MIEVLQKSADGKPTLVDALSPEEKDYQFLDTNFNLPETMLNDCLDPMHLPKLVKSNGVTFIIVRSFDETAMDSEDSVQGLTRKLAMFISDKFLILVHRKPLPYLEETLEEFRGKPAAEVGFSDTMLEILLSAVDTYYEPLEKAEEKIQRFENTMLRNPNSRQDWEEVFTTKSRLTVIKRMLWHILNSVQKFLPQSEINNPAYQEVRERVESLSFFTDSLLDNLNNLLNIQVSLASHSTNEIIRVLTLFSAVFMPLTFLVGVYGMNFEFMPELKWTYGYAFAWIVMIGTVAAIFLWFRRKGWIK